MDVVLWALRQHFLHLLRLMVLTKGMCIVSVIRYRELLALSDSFTNQILPRRTQIAPLVQVSDIHLSISGAVSP